MKVKLSPELSYIIGLWRKCRVFDGLGVKGDKALLEVFSKEALDKGLTAPDKMLTGEQGDSVFFYHTAYRKFFQDIEKDQMQRFRYLNEYAANYLAGMFDAVGDIDEKGIVSMRRMNRNDEMMLLRLGFHSKRRGELLIIERPVVFLAFIKNFVKLKKGHKAFEYLSR